MLGAGGSSDGAPPAANGELAPVQRLPPWWRRQRADGRQADSVATRCGSLRTGDLHRQSDEPAFLFPLHACMSLSAPPCMCNAVRSLCVRALFWCHFSPVPGLAMMARRAAATAVNMFPPHAAPPAKPPPLVRASPCARTAYLQRNASRSACLMTSAAIPVRQLRCIDEPLSCLRGCRRHRKR